jgi:Zn-dependent peptidase ImmA (M78 family)
VLVFEVSRVESHEMRGFSLPENVLPVIVLNGGESHAARSFSLMHEFAHLLLRKGGLCDLVESEENTQDARIEAFCNAVAGATLVPANRLAASVSVGARDWERDELEALADQFGTSKEVVLRRLLSMGRTSFVHYRRMREQFLEDRQLQESRPPSSGGPNPAVLTVRNLGRPFVRLVLEAYANERIALSSVSDYLGIKLRHLSRISSLMEKGETVE